MNERHNSLRSDPDLDRLVDQLRQASSVMVITGAGMSAESGLPTYRGVGGLYEDRETEDGIPIEQALSGPVFARDPEITWKYLGQIERGSRGAKFNRGHAALAELESRFERFWILTQNVDGFHTAAGSKNVIEIHGNLHQLQCMNCELSITVEDYSQLQMPPRCTQCESMMRPLVVLFEEQLPSAAIDRLDRELRLGFDVVISIGTSSHFPYIVQPVVMANHRGAFSVEINPTETSISDIVNLKIDRSAADVLERVAKQLASG